MQNKTTSWIIGIIIIILGIFLILHFARSGSIASVDTGTYSQAPGSTTSNGTSTSGVPSPMTPTAYTLAQVRAHNNASSCWSAINGNVYDLTRWINEHPGGPQAILSICGIDGSAAFNGQHGGQPRPASELSGFKIGALSQ